MKDFRIDNKGTKRLFENRFLERLTRTHFIIPVLFYYVMAAVCIIYATFLIPTQMWRLTYLFPAGFIVFTLVEYLIHRFIFHFNPKNEREEKIQYSIHGVHHEFPKDKDRLVMPPVISFVLSVVFFGLFYVVAGNYAWLFFPGFTSGYSTYLIIHYAIHRFRPPANFLKYLWKHHSLHHYKSTESAFSVSFPLWDYIFGTMPVKIHPHDHDEHRMPDYGMGAGQQQ